MQAYHNDQDLKDQTVALVRWHRAQDHIAQGSYYKKEGRQIQMCAVGCTLTSLAKITHTSVQRDDHGAYEGLIGVPRILAKLQDGIFEGLPVEDAVLFPEQFLAAIRPGADLSLVWPRFAVWLLTDETHGVIRHAKSDKSRAAIQRVADLYKQAVGGATIEVETWREARRAVGAAADAAAAAYAAAYAAADAAYAAAADDARFNELPVGDKVRTLVEQSRESFVELIKDMCAVGRKEIAA